VKRCGAALKYGNPCPVAATYGSTCCYFHAKKSAGLFDSRPAPRRKRSRDRLRLTDEQVRELEPIIRGVARDLGGGEDRVQSAWEGVFSARAFDPQRAKPGTTFEAYIRFHARAGVKNEYRRGLGDKRSKSGNYEANLKGAQNTFATNPTKLDAFRRRREAPTRRRVTARPRGLLRTPDTAEDEKKATARLAALLPGPCGLGCGRRIKPQDDWVAVLVADGWVAACDRCASGHDTNKIER
jgi:hypothetical protein